MINLCAPAMIYLIFSITQILIDTYNGLYNTAIIKGIVTITVTLLLNILCEQGLTVVSWIIVFVPFILMTVIVSMVLYVFGLDAASGKFKNKPQVTNSNDRRSNEKNSNIKCADNITIDPLGNIIIYSPKYNANANPVYYNSPNIIVPNPKPCTKSQSLSEDSYTIPMGSSSPAYRS
jgi:uncharacterized protein YacL